MRVCRSEEKDHGKEMAISPDAIARAIAFAIEQPADVMFATNRSGGYYGG
jgi:NADP-dependent 3-hydroxy acid dehydrogenase YdfG